MNIKALIPLIAGLAIGGFALKIGFDVIKKAQAAQTVQMADIWVAKEDIPRGAHIDEEMLTTVKFPAKHVPAGSITDKALIMGRVPRLDAPAGLPILDNMLLPPGATPGLWVKPGFRAVAVKIDESSGVDFHIEPGSRVDVVGYFTVTRNGKSETVARTLIEDVEIAAVGPRISATGAEEKAGSKPEKKEKARAVTLFVEPTRVAEIHYAEQRGKLKLSMRNKDDSTRSADRPTVTEEAVLGKSSAPAESTAKAGVTESDVMTMMKSFWDQQKDAIKAAPVAAGPVLRGPAGYFVRVHRGDKLETLRFRDPNSLERLSDTPDGSYAAHRMPGMRSAPQYGGGAKDNPSQSNTQDQPSEPEPEAQAEKEPETQETGE